MVASEMNELLQQRYARRGINKYRLQALLDYGGETILDVGCGSGAYVLALADERQIEGVDFSAFDSWTERPSLFKMADAGHLPYDDNSFDTVCSFETLEHLADPDQALREFHRVCRNNIIITVPNCEITEGMRLSNLLYSHWSDPTHCNFYNMETIKQTVTGSGFTIDRAYCINPINVTPFIMEAFGFSGLMLKVGRRFLRKYGKTTHYITTLVVGRKT